MVVKNQKKVAGCVVILVVVALAALRADFLYKKSEMEQYLYVYYETANVHTVMSDEYMKEIRGYLYAGDIENAKTVYQEKMIPFQEREQKNLKKMSQKYEEIRELHSVNLSYASHRERLYELRLLALKQPTPENVSAVQEAEKEVYQSLLNLSEELGKKKEKYGISIY